MKSPSFDASYVQFVIPTHASDTEFTVPHTLDRVPVEAFILRRLPGGGGPPSTLYRGTTAWDASNIYLKATPGGTSAGSPVSLLVV